ncbi:MAG: hypothetical protein KAI28_09505, partial [Sphingomonadales bacterium]|nr:hypothetical protein [Sphingomonadales bacterium]
MSTTATINNYIPGFRKTAGLVKREILDNKTSFVTLPLVIAGLIALTTIGNMFFSMDHIYAMVGVHEIGDMSIGGMGLNDYIDDMEPGAAKKLIGGAALALAVPLLMILPIVMINALLSTLFDDRKDRSYLFFKSMPISDTHEVVTKLGTILVGAPLISFAIAFALQIVVAIGISWFF